jgi:hypothetical protein
MRGWIDACLAGMDEPRCLYGAAAFVSYVAGRQADLLVGDIGGQERRSRARRQDGKVAAGPKGRPASILMGMKRLRPCRRLYDAGRGGGCLLGHIGPSRQLLAALDGLGAACRLRPSAQRPQEGHRGPLRVLWRGEETSRQV